ncbi:MAG: hypothetical protein IJF35_03130 [Clostridia bacterium]|nr:hypothetical protein [Clostridia bacterium]
MRGFLERLRMFLYGRNGIDALGKFSFAVYLIVAFINIFVRNVNVKAIIFTIQWLILLIVIFRIFSKNIPARRRENESFEKMVYKYKPAFSLLGERVKNIKTKRYRTCPNCKAVSRLPIKRGKHFVKCPKCNIPFKVYIII